MTTFEIVLFDLCGPNLDLALKAITAHQNHEYYHDHFSFLLPDA